MHILLFSDTHGNTQDMKKVISSYKNIDMVIHLGDLVKDVYKTRCNFENIKFECVAGNNDWTSSEPNEKVIEAEGKKILITHGHTYGVRTSTQKLVERGRQLEVDAVFYGHTHFVDEFYDDKMLIINPGSLGMPAIYQGLTYCYISIEGDKIVTEFKTVVQDNQI